MYIDYVMCDEIKKCDFPLIEIRQDRIRYYQDLYRRYGVALDIDFTRKIHSFESMSSHLFERLMKKVDMKTIEWILFPKSGLMLDGQYAAPELFLKEKYQLNCSVLDVRDCGSLSIFSAISLILMLSKNNKISNALLVSIAYEPTGDYVAALFLLKNNGAIQILYCGIFEESQKIAVLMESFNIPQNQSFFILEEDNVSIAFDSEKIVFGFSGSKFIYEVILKSQKLFGVSKAHYLFVISKDKKMGSIGLLLLKIK